MEHKNIKIKVALLVFQQSLWFIIKVLSRCCKCSTHSAHIIEFYVTYNLLSGIENENIKKPKS